MIMVLEPEKLTQRIALGLGVVALTIAAGSLYSNTKSRFKL
jgi:hypothetical protein